MRIIDEIQTISNAWGVPPDKMVVSYSNEDGGLTAWWIKSSTTDQYKYPEFVIEALEYNHGWWIRNSFDSLDWYSCFIHDRDDIDLGPHTFVMRYADFLDFYRPLFEAEKFAGGNTCNVVAVDYDSFKKPSELAKSIDSRKAPPYLKKVLEAKPEPDRFIDPDYPITYKVSGQEFKSLVDVDKFVRFDKLKKLVMFGLHDDLGQQVTKRIAQNSEAIIKLLKGGF